MSDPQRKLPLPDIYPDSERYWAEANKGTLMIKHCPACDSHHYYPRPHCPFCGNGSTDWVSTSGRGTVYSFSIMRAAPRPTAVAVVELAEGPMLTTVIVESDVHALRIGDNVVVTTLAAEGGQAIPVFTSVAAERARAYSLGALKAVENVPGLTINVTTTASGEVAAVVGAGAMGVGIATAFLNAGYSVCMIDQSAEALGRAQLAVRKNFDAMLKKGRISTEELEKRMAALQTSEAMQALVAADVIIEAVWEQMALKETIFSQIDKYAKPGAILGTNTSTLDVNQIALATKRPQAVVGLHFFNPAHVMPLLEVVRGQLTDDKTLSAAIAIGRRLGKVPVVVGVCDGFVGNRLMIARDMEADRLLMEGATPHQIDRILTEFGLPMGTYELADMAGGIELVNHFNKSTGRSNWLIENMVAAGRLGQKTGKGYYRYEPGKRRPLVDPEMIALIEQASVQAGIQRRLIGDEEVRDRLILPMINEGVKLVQEGIVLRSSDIDVVWQRGFGWPAWKGGPMYYADQLGLAVVCDRLRTLEQSHGERFQPAPLLLDLASSNKSLVQLMGAA